jgi:hypothetical protein
MRSRRNVTRLVVLTQERSVLHLRGEIPPVRLGSVWCLSAGDNHGESILDRRDEMDPWDAVDELWRLLEQKSRKKANYSTEYNILLVQSCDTDFRLVLRFAIDMPYEDLESLGINEIWLGDYCGVRIGAHSSIPFFGLYPSDRRQLTERPDWDAKPFG